MLGIGIDIVENERIKKSLNDEFIKTILTENEIVCFNKMSDKKKLLYICGRFTAKEALIKAISLYENPHMLEIEILNDDNGRPIAIYKNYKFLISISHENKYTVSEVILLNFK